MGPEFGPLLVSILFGQDYKMDPCVDLVHTGYVRIPDSGSMLRAHGFDLRVCLVPSTNKTISGAFN